MSSFKPKKAKKLVQAGGIVDQDGKPTGGATRGNRPVRIAIAVCSRDTVKAGFAFDLAKMVAFIAMHGIAPGKMELCILNNRGTLIVNQRHELVVEAMRNECDAILWLDDDMRFPPDTLFRLLAHDVPVVAANYCTRKEPVHPVAFTHVDRANPAMYRYCWTEKDSTGLEQVDTVGMGVMLTHISAFLSISPPAFNLTWNEAGAGFEGEDIYFCLKLREAGVKVMVDHDLSKLIQHDGEHAYELLVDGQIWKERAEAEGLRKRELWEAKKTLREAGIFNETFGIGSNLPDTGAPEDDGLPLDEGGS